jgi:bifunctional UDP-N-acetylglucosamine pyrophosphorylase / glucosamine-1-phosphate N-acetyltransferase
MIKPEAFFDLAGLSHAGIFSAEENVWEPLGRLSEFIASLFPEKWPLAAVTGLIQRPIAIHGGRLVEVEAVETSTKGKPRAFLDGELLEGAAILLPGAYLADDRILIGAGTIVEPGAMIKGPSVIGEDCEVRQGAYMRGNCLVGNRCVVGHATEMKGSIMLDGAKAGHFAYIGDSILGRDVNLGAGTKLANLRVIPGSIVLRSGNNRYDTGRRKLGAILGDQTETGCNAVTSPGTLMGPRSIVYPAVNVPGGCYPARTYVSPARGSLQIRSSRGHEK